MKYKPLIVVDDDEPDTRELFEDIAPGLNVEIRAFESWDKTKEFLENQSKGYVDGVILDARGLINSDSSPHDSHIMEAVKGMNSFGIPYAIYSAYTDELNFLRAEMKEGCVFTKGHNKHKPQDVIEYLKKKIANSDKLKIINKYPEPFQCFGGKYLDKKYERLLLDIITALDSDKLTKPEDILYNPCRILLEGVFIKVNETDEKVLPYALVNFDKQRPNIKVLLFVFGRKASSNW
ncbi:MAG: hypothetical protein K9I94_12600 [Bacteroidales bacterium]|nr:hypothetical protein [Bacteroidales bacterium]